MYEIFIKYLHLEGFINDIEKKILDEFIGFIKRQLNVREPIFLFLDTPINECTKRWGQRIDQDKFFVDIDLLLGIEKLSKQWKNKLDSENKKYYELNGEKEPEAICADIEFIIEFERMNLIRV